ncbi:hypothetical protein Sjap_003966 [Stephania japonica]|uniref:Uncharacterized protein n=1 Tax=Stephania japonica TaxID=461633 RepID=A0AAP0K2T9_9MAGN
MSSFHILGGMYPSDTALVLRHCPGRASVLFPYAVTLTAYCLVCFLRTPRFEHLSLALLGFRLMYMNILVYESAMLPLDLPSLLPLPSASPFVPPPPTNRDEGNYVNFNEHPKFDDDDQGFIEDTMVVFEDESRVVTIISMSTSFQVQVVVDGASVTQCSVEVVAKKEVKFVKYFCSLTEATDDANFSEVSQDFLDHIDLMGLESVTENFALFSIVSPIKLSLEEKDISDQKS